MKLAGSALIAAVVVAMLGACAQDPVKVENRASADYGRAQLHQAIAAFVQAGRTPKAYAALAARVRELLPTMDKAVADEAELKLTVLALAPTQAVADRPMNERVQTLALTLWPTAFTERLRPPALSRGAIIDQRQLRPDGGETVESYISRLCNGPLGQVCRDAVPEHQGALLYAHAVHHYNERARSAVSDCLVCGVDPSWREAVRGWEELDTTNNTWIRDVEKTAAPSNWPSAGPGAEPDAPLAEVALSELGELRVANRVVQPSQVTAVLRQHLSGSKEVALHVRPEVSLARLRDLASDLHAAGPRTIALVTREPHYPWHRRLYRVALRKGRRVDVRATDTVQIVLRQIDAAGPGLTRLD